MAKTITIAFLPDIAPPIGYIPSIDIVDPYRRGERLIPEMKDLPIEGSDETVFGFELPDIAAREILGNEEHVWKLWEPEKVSVRRPVGHGAYEVGEVISVKEAVTAKIKKAEAEAKKAAAAAKKKAAAKATGNVAGEGDEEEDAT